MSSPFHKYGMSYIMMTINEIAFNVDNLTEIGVSTRLDGGWLEESDNMGAEG